MSLCLSFFSLARFLAMRGSKTGNSMAQSIVRVFSIHKPQKMRKQIKKILAAARLSLDVHSTNKLGQTILHMLCDSETYHHGAKEPRQTRWECSKEGSASAEDDESDGDEEKKKAATIEEATAEAEPPTANRRNWYQNRGRKLTEALLSIALRKGADLYKPDNEGQLLLELNRSPAWRAAL